MNYAPMYRYPPGTILLSTQGYRMVKLLSGKWQSEHRLNAERTLGRDLREGERVFHKNGRREDNTLANLVVIRFALKKFERLPHTKVLFIPASSRMKPMTHRSGRVAVAA